MTQQQLFANYELDNSKWLAIIYKFLGGSLAVHLVLVLSAIYIPAVRDAFYVALLFSDAAGMKTVSRDYTLDDINDTATVLNLANPDRFRYPEGYFNNGESFQDPTILALNGDATLNGATTAPPLFDPTVPAPTPFPTPIVTTTPPIAGFPPVNPPPVARTRNRRAASLPPLPTPKPGATVQSLTPDKEETAKANTNQNANAQPSPSPGKNPNTLLSEDEINKQPLIDYGVKVAALQKDKKIDLNQPFAVTIEGDLEKGGKLSNATVTKKDGDQQLVELTKELVAVLNASNVLKVLSDVVLKDSPQQKHKIKFDVTNDPTNLVVNIALEVDNANRANTIQSVSNTIIAGTKLARKDKIEGQLLQNVRAETDGRLVVFKALMPRQDAQKLIQDQLAAAVKGQQDATKQ